VLLVMRGSVVATKWRRGMGGPILGSLGLGHPPSEARDDDHHCRQGGSGVGVLLGMGHIKPQQMEGG
jgi:hypothetical protein